MAGGGGQKYKIRLNSGRILGPMDRDRIRRFIESGHILGNEQARVHPDGEWIDIGKIRELADLMILVLREGKSPASGEPLPDEPVESAPLNSSTVILPETDGIALKEISSIRMQTQGSVPQKDDELEATVVESRRTEDELEPTAVEASEERGLQPLELATGIVPKHEDISDRETIVFSKRPSEFTHVQAMATDGVVPDRGPRRGKKKLQSVVIGLLAVLFAMELLFPDEEPEEKAISAKLIRPTLPAFVQKSSPQESEKIFNEGIRHYVLDNVEEYKIAERYFQKAASLDPENVKALAMLASTYLNLIDVSGKDENYFGVISKLIQMSQAKKVDLPETVIADVEFYLSTSQPDVAQNRIIEYTKGRGNFGLEMYYYLASVFQVRGDLKSAVRYLNQYPDTKAFSPKVPYLKGQIAEAYNLHSEAIAAYRSAIEKWPAHAKSHLRIAAVLNQMGQLQAAGKHLNLLGNHPELLSPRDMAYAYYLRGRALELKQKWSDALEEVSKAAKLDPDNSDYMLELYSLRARLGEAGDGTREKARMYYFLGEGEKLVKEGKYEDALTQFLQARQAQLKSPLPLVKIGDMFSKLGDIANARMNYQKASELADKNIAIWAKYIDTLIKSYDWAEAEKAMARFRKIPYAKSAIDKLAGDMYARQNRFVEAVAYYRKAMARETIDSAVYIAYANVLKNAGQCNDALLFYALSRRFDPNGTEPVRGTAECIVANDGIDAGIKFLMDELQKAGGFRAEVFAEIANFYLRKGDASRAQQFLNEAREANPNYALTWKIQAKLYLSNENTDKKAVDRAIESLDSYTDRNASDAEAFIEKYRLFTRRKQFDRALAELGRIYAAFPKYPGIHFYRANLFVLMGNAEQAVEEFEKELQNNPNDVPTLIEYGRFLVENGHAKEAMDRLSLAMQIAPGSSEAKHQAGYVSYVLKNYQGSVALLQAAASLDQGNPLIYKRLGLAYRALGKSDEAAAAFKRYIDLAPDAPDREQFEE